MPRPPHRYSAAPPIRNPRLGTTAKRSTRPHQTDVHTIDKARTKMGRSNAEGALRLVPWLWNLRPYDRPYYLLFVECLKPGIPFCTQVGHPGPLRPSDTERAIPYLDEVALDLPDLVIV